jgi:hypothetical protein
MHELGHGIGLRHVCPIISSILMEPNVTTAFDGPQHDDVRAAQRLYGDPFEGDNTSGSATNLGAIAPTTPVDISDAPAPLIANASLVSIDANGESDYYSFTTAGAEALTVQLGVRGLNYDSSTQNADGTCNSGSFINSQTMADLAFQVIDPDGITVLTTVDAVGPGATETLDSFALPGADTYFVRVYESDAPSQSQNYTLRLDVNEPPVAICQAFETSLDDACCAEVTVADVDGGSFDPNGAGDIQALVIDQVDGGGVPAAASVTICGVGPHTVRLRITDASGLTSTCVANVTLNDTTPPDVTCPTDLTVECTEHGGTSADDPQLAAFFAAFSTSDNCDPSPDAAHDAPALFPLGATLVTYTSTDDSGNESSCSATVTVEDTTPPVITVDLNRYVLWPPNHKMVDIEAAVEVTDVCDPNPTFVLFSITSNEPDDGLGDGSTNGDIQGADFGTADVEFQLRAERSGGDDGRVYTITYVASDLSDNETPNVVEVTVPHNRQGIAMAGQPMIHLEDTFLLIVLGSDELAVADIRSERVRVGNSSFAVSPISTQVRDVTDDGRDDLLLTFPSEDALLWRSMPRAEAIGLHYSTADRHYLVEDCFALGTEVVIEPEGVVSDDGAIRMPSVLYAPTPNPFRAATRLGYAVEADGPVDVAVFGVSGRRVRSLVSEHQAAGQYAVEWDGRDDAGHAVASGVYFYRLRTTAGQRVIQVTFIP